MVLCKLHTDPAGWIIVYMESTITIYGMHGQAYHGQAFAWTTENTAIGGVSQVDTDTLIHHAMCSAGERATAVRNIP